MSREQIGTKVGGWVGSKMQSINELGRAISVGDREGGWGRATRNGSPARSLVQRALNTLLLGALVGADAAPVGGRRAHGERPNGGFRSHALAPRSPGISSLLSVFMVGRWGVFQMVYFLRGASTYVTESKTGF